MPPVRVVLVDDHEIVRAGLATLLAREPDIHVVGTAATGEDGLELIATLQPDVAVVDYSLPHMSGIELCEQAAARHGETAVVILTGFDNDEVALNAIEAGASGYVRKDVDGGELKQVIRSVAKGETVFDSKVAARVLRSAHRRSTAYTSGALSIREVETLRLVARGSTNKDIAESLHVSENTVKTYLRRALEKLDCHSRSQAAVLAARRGLL